MNENLIIVVNATRKPAQSHRPAMIVAEKIATIEMGNASDGFAAQFTRDIEYLIPTPRTATHATAIYDGKQFVPIVKGLNAENCIAETKTDDTGNPIKAADMADIIRWLEKAVKNDSYRRYAPLLGLLKGFDASQWDCLEVLRYVH